MVDIFTIPLYYIGFKRNQSIEDQLEKVGFKDVNHFSAIDGRKMDVNQLLRDNIIGVRAYNDLVYGRSDITSITTLGAIGCTLSHMNLWKLCVDRNLPYMIIVEDDLIIDKIDQEDVKNIQDTLNYPTGLFISTNLKNGSETLIGTHLYFLTNEAAKQLLTKALPIDMQTDAYVGFMNNNKFIRANGYPISKQNKSLQSSTGSSMCIKCNLPKSNIFYIFIVVFILVLILVVWFLYKTLKKTQLQLNKTFKLK